MLISENSVAITVWGMMDFVVCVVCICMLLGISIHISTLLLHDTSRSHVFNNQPCGQACLCYRYNVFYKRIDGYIHVVCNYYIHKLLLLHLFGL